MGHESGGDILSTNAHFAAQFTPFMLSGFGAVFHSTALSNAGNHLTSDGAILRNQVGVRVRWYNEPEEEAAGT